MAAVIFAYPSITPKVSSKTSSALPKPSHRSMKPAAVPLLFMGLTAFQAAASPFTSFADPEASEEYAIDLLERLFPDEYNDGTGLNGTGLNETSLDKRQGRRLPRLGSSFLNYHSDLPSDSVAFGGNDTDLVGKYQFINGVSSLAWTAEYDNFTQPFKFNITADFGYCNTSMLTGTDAGVYTYANGTTTNSTRFANIVVDVHNLTNTKNYSDTQAMSDHLVIQASLAVQELSIAMGYIPKLCDLANQSTLVPGEQTSPPPNDTERVQHIQDELRRKLLMLQGGDDDDDGLNAAEQGSAGPSIPAGATAIATHYSTASASPLPAAASLLPGPTRHGYNFYVAVGSPLSLLVGAGGGFLNSLAWKGGDIHQVDWSAVTGSATGLLLGFLLAAAFLGRFLSFGTFNQAGAQTAHVVNNPADTILRPLARNTGTVRRRVVNTSRETITNLAVLANLRRIIQAQNARIAELEQEARENGLSGRPSDDPLGASELRQTGFSTTRPDFGDPGASSSTSGGNTNNTVYGADTDQGVCNVEQEAAAFVAGLGYLQGPLGFTQEDAVNAGLDNATGMQPVPEDEEIFRDDVTRDSTGHCHYPGEG